MPYLGNSIQESTMSDRFCILPFLHLHVSSNGKITPCCVNNTFLGDINQQKIDKVWNGEKMKVFRSKMFLPEGDKRCQVCYSRENGEATSIRQENNEKFKAYIPIIDEIKQPIYFDVRFSNICNLRCRTCWHGASSSWFDEAVLLKTNLGKNPIVYAAKDKSAFFEDITQYLQQAEEIYFAGGEPLVMDEHVLVLQKLIELGNTKIRLRYNTNFSNLKFKKLSILELWKKFEHVELGVSLDGHDHFASYIRKGSFYETLLTNRKMIATECPHIVVKVTPTISVLNIFILPEMILKLIEDQFVREEDFYFNILERPYHFNIKVLPQDLKDKLFDHYHCFVSQNNVSEELALKMNELLTYMKSEDLSHQLPEFKKQIQVLDAMRDENFEKTYKAVEMLVDLYQNIKIK